MDDFVEDLVDLEVQGKIMKWKSVKGKSFGFLTVEEFPETDIRVFFNQMSRGVSVEALTVGSLCRFKLKKNSRGYFKGIKLNLVDDEKVEIECEERNPENNQEIQGKILRWNFASGRGFGFLVVDNFPETEIRVFRNQMASNIDANNLTVGSLCRFLLKRNSKGEFKGTQFVLIEKLKLEYGDGQIQQGKVQSVLAKPKEVSQKRGYDKNLKEFAFKSMNPEDIARIDEKDISQIKSGMDFMHTLSAESTGTGPSTSHVEGDPKQIFVDSFQTFSKGKYTELALDLYSNIHKVDSAHAEKVESNNIKAAHFILHPDTCPHKITLDVILEVHRIVSLGLMDSAGVLRNKGARAGGHIFPRSGQVLPLLRKFIQLFQSHMEKYLSNNFNSGRDDVTKEQLSVQSIREACALAGWAGYHFVGIHPFCDANGRVSRLLMNWVLKRCIALPFPLCFCPSPLQRSLFIAAHRCAESSRLMAKHVSLRCAIALEDYFSMCTEAFKVASLEASSTTKDDIILTPPSASVERAVNAARIHLRTTCCLICMDEIPTLSTLCCGQPVHLNCLSNWLTQRRRTGRDISCPHCRHDMSETQGTTYSNESYSTGSSIGEDSTTSTSEGDDDDDDNDDDDDDDDDDDTATTSVFSDENTSTCSMSEDERWSDCEGDGEEDGTQSEGEEYSV